MDDVTVLRCHYLCHAKKKNEQRKAKERNLS